MNLIRNMSLKKKIAAGIIAVCLLLGVGGGILLASSQGSDIQLLSSIWPASFDYEGYVEPPFQDDPNRTNNAFNVADFGEQGSNGWFYRFGKAEKPHRSMRLEKFDGEKYFQVGASGLELKKDFVQPSEAAAPILEWRVAQNGSINVMVTYVKNVNNDKNPSYPDGVIVSIYKGEELLEKHNVDVKTDEEVLLETKIEDMPVVEDESIYVVVDDNANNAYDGGLLYVAIEDANKPEEEVPVDLSRKDNNANYQEDYGDQGRNGWYYKYGKDLENSAITSSTTADGYLNFTSPGLQIGKDFVHPAINDNAVIEWQPYRAGTIDVRCKYTKFAQNDGNPKWPDGVTVSAYLNDEKLFEQAVESPEKEGENKISFRKPGLQVKPEDKLYFVVDANGNTSYDGGAFEIVIMDTNGRTNENDISVRETETRQNLADTQYDFGEQGTNGWFYQEGWGDDPFNAYNMTGYIKDDKYVDDSYLEIKRDFASTGTYGKSAVIKWKVAQNGTISIDASYKKFKNEDKNPSWPDGTRVTLYHNNTVLRQEEFAAVVGKDVEKSLDVDSLKVKRGDYITMVINGKDNNAYDAANYTFAIRPLSHLVGKTEDDITIPNDKSRTNNADVKEDFGKQGENGWFYQYGLYDDPFFAVNIEKYEDGEKYYTEDGIEIKRDFIMPATKGKSAIVKWKVAQDGKVDVNLIYTKLANEDANPSWPDGVTVTLLKNQNVLKKVKFAPERREVTKDLSVENLPVKKGDYITMIVNGLGNTAYDGGTYSFSIEDAAINMVNRVNNSGENWANLEADFGAQGSNGWYYLEGKSLAKASILKKKSQDGTGFKSQSEKDLELKKDFVQPGVRKHAMYQWVVAKNGKVDIRAQYTKFGHQDKNPSWPDGTKVRIYKNSKLLAQKDVKVHNGDGNDNTIDIVLNSVSVAKGDIITFDIDGKQNNAWDGGRLRAQINPEMSYKPAPDNQADLAEDFGKQGNEGWYYGVGTNGSDFVPAYYKNGEYSGYKHDNLLLKKDGVHPSRAGGAIYRWVAGADGTIDLNGVYIKSRDESTTKSNANGVKLAVYLNGKVISGMEYDVSVSKTQDIEKTIEKSGIKVKKGDKIDFVITGKKNVDWDYGVLKMDISDPENPLTPDDEYLPGTENKANLADDFGEQGSNGWYYLEGTLLAKATKLTKKNDDGSAYRSETESDLELKKDFVNPGAGKHAMYRWVVAKDGEIDFYGNYVKFGHQDPNTSWPDGTKVKIYKNNEVIFEEEAKVLQGDGNNTAVEFSFEKFSVKKGDFITFDIDAKKNVAWDGGRLSVQVKPYSDDKIDFKPAPDNQANLADDFGEQGNEGWYYGAGNTSDAFVPVDYNSGEYTSAKYDSLLLKKDGVHPSMKGGAIYRWVAGEDGKIDLRGSYHKSRNENADDNAPDGVKVAVYKNGTLVEGMSYDVAVSKTEETVQKIEKSELEVMKGDQIDFIITAKDNAAWDYGVLKMDIATSGSAPEEEEIEFTPAKENKADLAADFGEQGSNGWYYGAGNVSSDFVPATYKNGEYSSDDHEGLLLKKDGVHPSMKGGAIYRWVVGEDGEISLDGNYYKSRNENADDNAPDGVKVAVYKNGTLVEGMSYDVAVSKTEETVQNIAKEKLEVKKGDQIDFIITAKDNAAWDYGKLEMKVAKSEAVEEPKDPEDPTKPEDPENPTDPEKPEEPEEPKEPKRENNASLSSDFGEQGSNGWYYGACDWDGSGFSQLSYDGDRYYNGGKPELKRDFVEPGNGRNAAYKWVAGQDGSIKIEGSYTKFANADDSEANGVCLRIFVNGNERRWIGDGINHGGLTEEVTVSIYEEFDVKEGDEIIFAVNPEGNDAWDGGRLSINISAK